MTRAPDVGAQLRKGVVEYCVLGLLQHRPTYGWKLSEALIDAGLIGSIGTLYPLLARLRQGGLVSAGAGADEAASSRRYYTLTAAGRVQLDQFRVQWLPFTRAVEAAIAKPETP